MPVRSRAMLFVGVSSLAAACGGVAVTRVGPPQERVVARAVRAAPDAVRAAVLDAFAARRSAQPPPFNTMLAHALAPPAYDADWAAGFVDAGGYLDGYNRLPAAARRLDVLIDEPTQDVYWASEYMAGGEAVRFRCGLIVHVADASDAGSAIEVYELVPTVWAGEHWAFSRHGIGFGRYHDIRFVEPTVRERTMLADLVARLVDVQ